MHPQSFLKKTLIPLLVLLSCNYGHAQSWNHIWQQLDSFYRKNLPKSAWNVANQAINKAKIEHNDSFLFKAQLIKLNLISNVPDQYANDKKYKYLPDESKGNAAQWELMKDYELQAKGIYKQLWQNELGTFLNQNNHYYYHKNDTSLAPNDWSQIKIYATAHQYFQQSLSNEPLLKNATLNVYAAILTEQDKHNQLQHNLYDILAEDALNFYISSSNNYYFNEHDSLKFELNDASWFEPAERFSEKKMKVSNSLPPTFNAITLFQRIIAQHLKDSQPDAAIYWDIRRISFVNEYFKGENKDSLYQNALEQIIAKYPNNKEVAKAKYLLIAQKGQNDPSFNLKAQHQAYLDLLNQFPNTEGAQLAINKLNSIEWKSLDLNVENYNIPNEPIKALLTFKNMPKVYFRLYKIPYAESDYQDEDYDSVQLTKTPVKVWVQNTLPDNDFEKHRAEIALPEMPSGRYLLYASDSNNFVLDSCKMVKIHFDVTSITVLNNTESNTFLVLNRKTGTPINNVLAEKEYYIYDTATKKNHYFTYKFQPSDEHGFIDYDSLSSLKKNNTTNIGLFYIGNDTFKTEDRTYYQTSRLKMKEYATEDDTAYNYKTYFFTDRGIYRPGQKVQFKALVIKNYQGNTLKNEVAAFKKIKVVLEDANSEEMDSLYLTTNDFGSAAGSFSIPTDKLTGEFTLSIKDFDDSDNDGDQSFSVEEYKRPKFEVKLDPIKAQIALNQSIKITGSANAFSGSKITGAIVKYNVQRSISYPYRIYDYSSKRKYTPTYYGNKEIVNKTTVTDENGNFDFSFIAEADSNVKKEDKAIFDYKITVSITDLNGETHEQSYNIYCGYQTIKFVTHIPEKVDLNSLKESSISTTNLNGQFVPQKVHLTIIKLTSPTFLKNRLWESPDIALMDKSTFKKLFPNDPYMNESDYQDLPSTDTIISQDFTTNDSGKVSIFENIKPTLNGWYKLSYRTIDRVSGDTLQDGKYVQLNDPQLPIAPNASISILTDKDSYEPGETAKITIRKPANSPNVILDNGLTTNNLTWTQDITATNYGGIPVSATLVWNNRIYSEAKVIQVPWMNKTLQITTETHRDKLQPGAEDTWTVHINGYKKEKVAAEFLTTMYDASLDQLGTPFYWPYFDNFKIKDPDNPWQNLNNDFSINHSNLFTDLHSSINPYESFEFYRFPTKIFTPSLAPLYLLKTRFNYSINEDNGEDEVVVIGYGSSKVKEAFGSISRFKSASEPGSARSAPSIANATMLKDASSTSLYGSRGANGVLVINTGSNNVTKPAEVSPRTNLNETAFFFPQLRTDDSGNLSFTFKIPEALTRWKMKGLAHTKTLQMGEITDGIITQKDLMVTPNLPRFFRQGDQMIINAKIANLSKQVLNGKAHLTFINTITNQVLDLPFRLTGQDPDFSINPGQNSAVSWNIIVPETVYDPVIVRVTASAGNFTDGEENTLPVISNRTLVTEGLPLQMLGDQTKIFTLQPLLDNNSSTLVQKGITLEYTSNPAWYAIQSLPYLMEFEHECAEQTFNRYYANSISTHILNKAPKVKAIFEQWAQNDSAGFVNKLSQNQALKTALLTETPWVLEGKSLDENNSRLGNLFNTYKLGKEQQSALNKLKNKQLPNGGFPWFGGTSASRYISEYISMGIARLNHLNVASNKDLTQIQTNLIKYLDGEMDQDYNNINKKLAKWQINDYLTNDIILHLYTLSFEKNAKNIKTTKSYQFYLAQESKHWQSYNPYMQALMAVTLYRNQQTQTAHNIMASLDEQTFHSEEMGMYWFKNDSYWWYEAPIESEAALIEAYSEILKDSSAVNQMKTWLIKQKSAQNWATTKATADASYALFLTGNNWLSASPNITIKMGNYNTTINDKNSSAGAGYFKTKINGDSVKNDMGKIVVTTANTKGQPSWGAAYWQYFEDVDKVPVTEHGLNVKKEILLNQNGKTQSATDFKVGDKVTIRLTIQADNDYEFVHLKDQRGAFLEPNNVYSGYQYQNGLSFYQSTKDISTNFFIDYLRKGTYVIEYTCFVMAKGQFGNGLATIQCMYAPEFGNHSAGFKTTIN